MNISLAPELDKMVRQKVKTGMYSSASEVVREALRLLQAQEVLQQQKLEALRMEVQKGVASLDACKGVEMNDDIFEGVKQRGRKRLKELKYRAL